jgi:ribosomal protein S18 acetylase RimI-like enzyme
MKIAGQKYTSQEQYKAIFVSDEDEFGSAEGYVVSSTAEQLDNWAADKGFSEKNIQELRNKFKKISFLKSIFVDEDERNRGIGNEILDKFINEVSFEGAEAILLEADTGEKNHFNLVEWYEDFGFLIIEREKHPLMVLEMKKA